MRVTDVLAGRASGDLTMSRGLWNEVVRPRARCSPDAPRRRAALRAWRHLLTRDLRTTPRQPPGFSDHGRILGGVPCTTEDEVQANRQGGVPCGESLLVVQQGVEAGDDGPGEQTWFAKQCVVGAGGAQRVAEQGAIVRVRSVISVSIIGINSRSRKSMKGSPLPEGTGPGIGRFSCMNASPLSSRFNTKSRIRRWQELARCHHKTTSKRGSQERPGDAGRSQQSVTRRPTTPAPACA